MSLSKVLF